MNESKKEIYYTLIPQKIFFPKTDLILGQIRLKSITWYVARTQIKYPFIAKPILTGSR
jgi:hypothetical protein